MKEEVNKKVTQYTQRLMLLGLYRYETIAYTRQHLPYFLTARLQTLLQVRNGVFDVVAVLYFVLVLLKATHHLKALEDVDDVVEAAAVNAESRYAFFGVNDRNFFLRLGPEHDEKPLADHSQAFLNSFIIILRFFL